MLPNLDDFPIFFQEDEMSLLEGSPFLDLLQRSIVYDLVDYDELQKVVPNWKYEATNKQFTSEV